VTPYCACGLQDGFGPFGLVDTAFSDSQRDPIVTSQNVQFVRASNIASTGLTASKTRTDGSVPVASSVAADAVAANEVRWAVAHRPCGCGGTDVLLLLHFMPGARGHPRVWSGGRARL
jgi:hypothetical protein